MPAEPLILGLVGNSNEVKIQDPNQTQEKTMSALTKTRIKMHARGLTIAILISSVFVASCTKPKDVDEESVIREARRLKCEEQAVQWLRWVVPSEVEAGQIFLGNQNTIKSHYNSRMKKCLVHHKFTTFEKIVDINENNALAQFAPGFDPDRPLACHVGDEKCKNHAEWESLAAPYMKD